jgi:starch-binding outer membrane protein, SusD/RagB family
MKIGFYIATAFALLMLGGCGDDFLDKKPNEQLSQQQIEEASKTDLSLLNGYVAGIYANMYKTETGGTTDHDDFGQKGYDIYSDMLSSDMVLGAVIYGWYSQIARYQATKDYTVNPAYEPWRYYYRIIQGANGVIDALGGTDSVQTETTQQRIMGQAKALRAYGYFYLTQFYSTGYGDGTERILPIYTTTKVPNQPLSTTAQVYDLMVSDLTQAIGYLNGFSRTSKDQINASVAKGLLAYVLAARGTTADLQQVVELTNDIINTGGFRLNSKDDITAQFDEDGLLINPQSGFNKVSNLSWMWGVDLTLANNLDLVSWWGQVDLFTYSYAWAGDPKIIDNGLYEAIRDDDVRKQQFVDVYGDGQLWPINKFYASHRTRELDGDEIGGQRSIIDDYVYMRIEEIYLLNAEANAKLNNEAEAKQSLTDLLERRIDDYSYIDALTGQALLDEIHLQTRIELWGEGKTYLSVKRNKVTVTRGDNHLFLAGQSFTYDSDELTFPIPQAEVLNNPVLNQ